MLNLPRGVAMRCMFNDYFSGDPQVALTSSHGVIGTPLVEAHYFSHRRLPKDMELESHKELGSLETPKPVTPRLPLSPMHEVLTYGAMATPIPHAEHDGSLTGPRIVSHEAHITSHEHQHVAQPGHSDGDGHTHDASPPRRVLLVRPILLPVQEPPDRPTAPVREPPLHVVKLEEPPDRPATTPTDDFQAALQEPADKGPSAVVLFGGALAIFAQCYLWGNVFIAIFKPERRPQDSLPPTLPQLATSPASLAPAATPPVATFPLAAPRVVMESGESGGATVILSAPAEVPVAEIAPAAAESWERNPRFNGAFGTPLADAPAADSSLHAGVSSEAVSGTGGGADRGDRSGGTTT